MKNFSFSAILIFYFLAFCIGLPQQAFTQLPTYQIFGPYNIPHPGPFHVKLQFNFIINSSPTTPWITQQEANTRAGLAIANLNQVYNQFNIFFFNGGGHCNTETAQIFTYDGGANATNLRAALPSAVHEDAIDIYIFPNDLAGGLGFAYSVPSNYCHVLGKDENGIPATQSQILVHEIGHCLGLSHTFTGVGEPGCEQKPSGCFPAGGDVCDCAGLPAGYCCGDFVADTEINPESGSINTIGNCLPVPTNVTVQTTRNYMSYVNPGTCRDQFTPEQGKRMQAYLFEAPLLQDAQGTLTYQNGMTVPQNPTGNIIVPSGQTWTVQSQVNMPPGSYIYVKRGGTLTVQSVITGACNKMWQGIIVEGDGGSSQGSNMQGQVTVKGTGIVEHAVCGINVNGLDANGVPAAAGGGGVVYIAGGILRNNITSIKFSPYTWKNGIQTLPNKSSIASGKFSTTNEFRGGSQKVVNLDMNGIYGLRITSATRFQDFRTMCSGRDSRVKGIISLDAGFIVSGGIFENLDYGIQASQVNENIGAFSISTSLFKDCYTGVYSTLSDKFTITGATFEVNLPEMCGGTETAVGIKLEAAAVGFEITGNTFEGNWTEDGKGRHGTEVWSILDQNNEIFKNNYSGLTYSNVAFGTNGFTSDDGEIFRGLQYQCNEDEFNTIGESDFLIKGGLIRKEQGDRNGALSIAAGNTFGGLVQTIRNQGALIDYFYIDTPAEQDPGDQPDVNEMFTPNSNPRCEEIDPCPPPCLETIKVQEWKDRFFDNREQWTTKVAAFPLLTDPVQKSSEAQSINKLRLEMDRDGHKILMTLALDTTNFFVDSLTVWLANMESYPADLRLARHHFFTGSYQAFYDLVALIPSRYDLSGERLADFNQLLFVYANIRPHLQNGGELNKMPGAVLDSIAEIATRCNEAGFLAKNIFWRNGQQILSECQAENFGEKPEVVLDSKKLTLDEVTRIFPNPANETITIVLTEKYKDAVFEIIDFSGRVVLSKRLADGLRTHNTSIKNIPIGLYFIRIRGEGMPSFSEKLVINH